jgi:hypothetical protein
MHESRNYNNEMTLGRERNRQRETEKEIKSEIKYFVSFLLF